MKAVKISLAVFAILIIAIVMYVSVEIATLLAGQIVKLSSAGRAEIAFAVIFTEIFTKLCNLFLRMANLSLSSK